MVTKTLGRIFLETPVLRFNPEPTSPFDPRLLQEGWNRFLGWIYLILISVLATAWSRILDEKRWRAIVSDSRPWWIMTYFSFIAIGILISSYLGFSGRLGFGFWVSLLVLLFGFVAAFLLSIHLNNIHDLEIDRFTNQERPLVKGMLTRAELTNIDIGLLLFAFLAASSLGFEMIFLFLTISGISYIYSAPPLRLRRIFILSNLLLGFGATLVVPLGFLVASGRSLIAFPLPFLILLFLVILGFFGFTKDIKDSESDKKAGITTLVNYFPQKIALLIMSAMLFIAVALVGFFFNSIIITV
ncbi:MAG: UbiA family prenyltransferase, partial [Candidatus Paceibacteria bacterium]